MTDLINRNTAIAHIEDTIKATEEKNEYDSGFVAGLEYCKSYIEAMPLFASSGSYERAVRTFQKNLDSIHNPMAWALYQTLKEYD